VQGNGRPYCDNASNVLSDGPSSASVIISCTP
jgi:hypothetical protein